MELCARIDEARQRWDVLKHPFYERWERGELSREDLAFYAAAGISTTVLEGALVGRGSTAASSALLLKEPDRELTQLTKRYGARASRRIWELSHQSVDQLVALLQRRRIRCDRRSEWPGRGCAPARSRRTRRCR